MYSSKLGLQKLAYPCCPEDMKGDPANQKEIASQVESKPQGLEVKSLETSLVVLLGLETLLSNQRTKISHTSKQLNPHRHYWAHMQQPKSLSLQLKIPHDAAKDLTWPSK